MPITLKMSSLQAPPNNNKSHFYQAFDKRMAMFESMNDNYNRMDAAVSLAHILQSN